MLRRYGAVAGGATGSGGGDALRSSHTRRPAHAPRLHSRVARPRASAAAQTPDTTRAWYYAPLVVGNVWEYERWEETCLSPFVCTTEQGGLARTSVTGEAEAGGLAYRVLRGEVFGNDGTLYQDREGLVRFDTLAGHLVTRVGDAEEAWPIVGIDCRLDAAFDSMCGQNDGIYVQQGGSGSPSGLEGDKTFLSLIPGVTYQRDVGVVSKGGSEFGGSWRELTWARVGGVEVGQAVLADEARSTGRRSCGGAQVVPASVERGSHLR